MASQPGKWPWTAISHPSTKSSCRCYIHAQRQRVSSSSSSLQDSSYRASATKPGPKIPKAANLASSCLKRSSGNGVQRTHGSSSTLSESGRRQYRSFKSLFGNRYLWWGIPFASKKVRSIILLNVITFIYASNIPVVKAVESVMDPSVFTVVRFAVSAIPFMPFVIQARDDVQTRNAGIELGCWVSLGYLMQALGLLTSDAGRASFISMLTVIVVPLFDGLLGSKIPVRIWFGAVSSIVGVAMLESSGSPPCVGDILNFLSAVFFGIHMLRTEHISRATDKKNFLSLLAYEVCVIAISSSLWYLIGGWIGGNQEFDGSPWSWTIFWGSITQFPWIPALYTGVFSTGLCLWFEMAVMCDVSATEAAIIYALEPVWGGGFAWFLLGERWGITGWIGAALILGGSLAVQLFGLSSPAKINNNGEIRKNPSISHEQSGLSSSPIVVSSRKDLPDMLKK